MHKGLRKETIVFIQHSQMQYLFGDWRDDEAIPDKAAEALQSFLSTESLYIAAAREIMTKLENLNDEFRISSDRQPIQQIKTRIKTPKSIFQKLVRDGCEVSLESAKKELNDIAGVRVICSYIDDIYTLADLLVKQNDVELLRTRDYIKAPKPNGYRSLHLVVTVPVFLSKCTENVKVEIQIRTIAMDFWASLEHELAYKFAGEIPQPAIKELYECAQTISQTDARMQNLRKVLMAASEKD